MTQDTKEKKKEKKAAGVPWSVGGAEPTISRAPQILLRGAASRSFLGAIAHFFTTWPGMLTLTAMVAGTSFFSLWDLNRQKEEALAKRRAEAFHQGSGSQSGAAVQGNASPNGDSLSYLAAANQGALGGAAPAAQPAPAAPQPDASAAKDDGKATTTKGNADASGQAQAAAQAAGLANRFGQMSTGLGAGNGLAGGVGMAGGVGRPFDSKDMLAQAGHGSLSKMPGGPAPSTAGVTSRSVVGGGSKGAMGQLRAANGMSVAAKTAGSGEGQSYQAGQAFDSNPGIAGTGAGSSIGGTGDTTGATGSPAAGVSPGSPVSSPSSVSPSNSGGSSAPSAGNGTDVTPWSSLATLATILITVAGLLFLISNFLSSNPAGFPWKKVLSGIAGALAAVVTGLGIMMMVEYGQMLQGGIFTAVGALLTTLSILTATGVIGGPTTVADTAAQPGATASAQALAGSGVPNATPGPGTGGLSQKIR